MGHNKLVIDNPSSDYPLFLKKVQTQGFQADEPPIVVRMSQKGSERELKELVSKLEVTDIVDSYAEQYAELLLSKNAHLYRANYEVQVSSIAELINEHYAGRPAWQLGSWVFFPWRKQLVHILDKGDFETLRTIRNRDLITAAEQTKLFDFRVASFGMSVGSAGALAMAITGISRKLKLIDGAVISGSNLNRILTGVSSVGKNKAHIVGQQIYEMNPYSEVAYYDRATKDNIGGILESPWRVDMAVDEIDDIETKIRIRYEARARKIPVVMATELGDTIILDVERFDLEPTRPLLHNLIPGVEILLENPLENYREWIKHALKIIDPSNMTIKMQHSLLKIGSTIVTHPQLGSTVMMTGGVLAFAAKSIACGWDLKSGRYIISLEKELLAGHKTRRYRREHKRHTKVLNKAVNSM
ncbi:MAG: ThiF family adenylyltransferase [Candidatus Saccharimonadales bacterium]